MRSIVISLCFIWRKASLAASCPHDMGHLEKVRRNSRSRAADAGKGPADPGGTVESRSILALESRPAQLASPSPARTPSGMSREPPKPSTRAPFRPLAPGWLPGHCPAPRRARLGRLAIATNDRGSPAEEPSRFFALARRVRRLALSEHASGGRVCRGRGLRPVPPGDRQGL